MLRCQSLIVSGWRLLYDALVRPFECSFFITQKEGSKKRKVTTIKKICLYYDLCTNFNKVIEFINKIINAWNKMHLKMHALENIHSLNCKIKSVTFFNWMVNCVKWGNIIEHQKNAIWWKKTSLNKLLTFLSTMQQTALHFDHFWARCEWSKNWSAERGCWNCYTKLLSTAYFSSISKFSIPKLFFSFNARFSSTVHFLIHCEIFHPCAIYHPTRDYSSIVHNFIHCGWNCILGRIHLTVT